MKIQYLKNVASLELDKEKCTGCKMCIEVCPHNVFRITDKKAEIINKDSCIECGACMKNCEFGALKVKSGVGCANAIIKGMINKTAPECCSSDQKNNSGCCS